MRTHVTNAIWGICDYLAYPIGMLAAAPLALRVLGFDRFGVWMISNSAISIGAVIASGFGDANVQYVAGARAVGDHDNLLRGVRASMGIHLLLGAMIALSGWLFAPLMAERVVASLPSMRVDCLWSLRIAASLAVVRAIETVCIGTQRAFERYGEAVRLSVFARLLSLIIAVVVPLVTPSVTSIMVASAGISLLSVWLQMARLHSLLGISVITPLLDAEQTRALLSFGAFTWIQAVSALLFGQVDRVITGIAFGAVALSSYSLCAQLSQPLYGITAAGLHFLVPRITIQRALGDWVALRRTMLLGFCANSLMVAFGSTVLLLFGEAILRIWGGEEVARIGKPVLPLMVWGTALPALTVSGVYSMLALGRVRIVTLLSLIAGAMMLVPVPWLLAHYGVVGMAYARIIYGPISLVVYFPLFQLLRRGRLTTQSISDSAPPTLCEAER